MIIGHVSGGLNGIIQFEFVYGIHLVMFFLLSGYTLKKKPIGREYLNSRFSRLMTPYFYTCLAVMLTDILNCRIISHDFSIKTVTGIIGRDLTRSFFASGSITNFTTIEIGTRIGAIWFLPALFFASLILQLLLQKTEDDRILGISTAFIALVGHISGRFLWLPFSIQPGMFAVFFFG